MKLEDFTDFSNINIGALEDVWSVFWVLLGIFLSTLPKLLAMLRKQGGYRLSGNYISRFEDEENDLKVVTKSFCTVQQFGGYVRFKDKTSSGRTWILEGELDEKGRILGKYQASDSEDTGIGVFYFKCQKIQFPKNACDLIGFWSGYDHANKRDLLSGVYMMTKVSSAKIKPLKKDDVDQASNLVEKIRVMSLPVKAFERAIDVADSTFGPEYVDVNSFNISYGKPVLLQATENGIFLGFVIAYLLDKGKLSEAVFEGKAPSSVALGVVNADRAGTLGVIKTVAVDPSHHGRGIGTRLITAAEKALKNLGAREVIVPAWEGLNSRINIQGVLDLCGYTLDGKIDGLWKSSCDKGEFKCIEGRPGGVCVCNAVYFKKTL